MPLLVFQIWKITDTSVDDGFSFSRPTIVSNASTVVSGRRLVGNTEMRALSLSGLRTETEDYTANFDSSRRCVLQRKAVHTVCSARTTGKRSQLQTPLAA